jgi:hypothetical protein
MYIIESSFTAPLLEVEGAPPDAVPVPETEPKPEAPLSTVLLCGDGAAKHGLDARLEEDRRINLLPEGMTVKVLEVA